MYRKKLKIEKAEDLNIQLPKEYLNKEVELTVLDVNEATTNSTENDFEDAMKFFDSIQIDMSNFKFNREEANER
jgi:hypothetical protein